MCDLCQLARGAEEQHLTQWYYLGLPGQTPDHLTGIVVEDLDCKGHELRLLWVPREHIHAGDETQEMRKVARHLLVSIATAIAANKNLVISGYDFNKHSYKKHWHAQIILDEPEEVSIGLFR